MIFQTRIKLVVFSILLGCMWACTVDTTPEVWKSEYISIKSAQDIRIDSLKDHSQYLYLYSNGDALLIDSTASGHLRRSETQWEIKKYNGTEVFGFGFGNEASGIRGVAYPITKKNDSVFLMKFDSLSQVCIWNLKRVPYQTPPQQP